MTEAFEGPSEPKDRRTGDAFAIWLRELTFEWQDREDVLDRAIPQVPPGFALRYYQNLRDRRVQKLREKKVSRKLPEVSPDLATKEAKIRSGARAWLIHSLTSRKYAGGIEIKLRPKTAQDTTRRPQLVRRRERRKVLCCPNCGTQVQGPRPDDGD